MAARNSKWPNEPIRTRILAWIFPRINSSMKSRETLECECQKNDIEISCFTPFFLLKCAHFGENATEGLHFWTVGICRGQRLPFTSKFILSLIMAWPSVLLHKNVVEQQVLIRKTCCDRQKSINFRQPEIVAKAWEREFCIPTSKCIGKQTKLSQIRQPVIVAKAENVSSELQQANTLESSMNAEVETIENNSQTVSDRESPWQLNANTKIFPKESTMYC